MDKLDAAMTGLSLAVTVVIAYTVCAFLFLAVPDLAASFLESLFHGLQFSRLEVADARFRFTGFGVTAIALFVYAFFVGWLFAIVRNMFVR